MCPNSDRCKRTFLVKSAVFGQRPDRSRMTVPYGKSCVSSPFFSGSSPGSDPSADGVPAGGGFPFTEPAPPPRRAGQSATRALRPEPSPPSPQTGRGGPIPPRHPAKSRSKGPARSLFSRSSCLSVSAAQLSLSVCATQSNQSDDNIHRPTTCTTICAAAVLYIL